jgi:hypothetical protein
MTAATGTARPLERFRGPHVGIMAVVFTLLFNAGLYPLMGFGGGVHFPGPYDSAAAMASYFAQRSHAAMICAFFHFGAAIALGLFTAVTVHQIRFLGVRAAGSSIALFGGFATAWNMTAAACVMWAMASSAVAQNPVLTQVLYYLQFAFGGPGFSVPMGLLIAGISVTALFAKLLPRWIAVFGILLAICGEVSWFTLLTRSTLPLIPLVRFPGFLWLMLCGFSLQRTRAARGVLPAVEKLTV